ncbi:50S ribosomal protein L1, partial [Haliangium sp. UPWRP_2]
APIGNISFGSKKLEENARSLIELLIKLKPQTAKGTYVKSITVSTTHGPGIKLEPNELQAPTA